MCTKLAVVEKSVRPIGLSLSCGLCCSVFVLAYVSDFFVCIFNFPVTVDIQYCFVFQMYR